MEKNQIFIKTGTKYKKMTRELLEESNLAELIGDKNTDFWKTGSRGPFDKRRHCTRYFLYNTLRNDSASLEIRSREKQDCYGGGGSSNLSGGCCM